MANTSAVILIPTKITEDMLKTGTSLPALAPGEVAWAAGAAHAVDLLRVYKGGVYSCVREHSGRVQTPDMDPQYWLFKEPSMRMLAFDDYGYTVTRATGELVYVIQPGFCSGIDLDNLEGDYLEITVRDAPGGTVIKHYEGDLYEQALGLYELLFAPLAALRKLSLSGIESYPDAEVTIRITSGTSANPGPVGVGRITIGDWRTLLGVSKRGGVAFGATVDLKTHTHFDEADDGKVKVTRRPSGINVSCQVLVDADDAATAVDLLMMVLHKPVAFVGTDIGKYSYINTYGFISASASADNVKDAKLSLKVKGLPSYDY